MQPHGNSEPDSERATSVHRLLQSNQQHPDRAARGFALQSALFAVLSFLNTVLSHHSLPSIFAPPSLLWGSLCQQLPANPTELQETEHKVGQIFPATTNCCQTILQMCGLFAKPTLSCFVPLQGAPMKYQGKHTCGQSVIPL